MFRAALPALRSLPLRRTTPLLRPQAVSSVQTPAALKWRAYAAASGLSQEDISARVMDVMKTFEKVDGGKVGVKLLSSAA